MTAETKGAKKGQKGEVVEPILPQKPTFDFGVDEFNEESLKIWEARDKLNQKTLERSPPIDDKSSKGKKKKKPKQAELSAGRKSLNDSALDMSGGASILGVTQGDNMIMNQSLTANTSKKNAIKVKPRDFQANPKLLRSIGAENYDQYNDLHSEL